MFLQIAIFNKKKFKNLNFKINLYLNSNLTLFNINVLFQLEFTNIYF